MLFPIEPAGTSTDQIQALGSRLYGRLRSHRAERLALTRLLDLYLPFLRCDRLELRQGPAGPGVCLCASASSVVHGYRCANSTRDYRSETWSRCSESAWISRL